MTSHGVATPATAADRSFTFEDAEAVYKLSEEASPLGEKVKDALGVIDKAIADYGCVDERRMLSDFR